MTHSTIHPKRVTLADVAAKAGVSPSAVSIALSRRSTTATLKPDTHQRILQAVAELNYRPNLQARGLVSQKSFMVGMLSRRVFDDSIISISAGVESELRHRDYSLLNYVRGEYGREMADRDQLSHEAEHLRLALERHVDGLIVMPVVDSQGKTQAHRFTELQRQGMPIVQLFSQVLPGIAVVRPDHDQGVAAMVDHLVELGHRRIVHVTHEGTDPARDPSNWHGDARLIRQVYERRMAHHGLPPRVLCYPLPARGEVGFIGSGELAARMVLSLDPKPTAIMAYTDYLALGILRRFHQLGMRVPQEMSLTGINNVKASQAVYPALTTIDYPREEMGRQAAKLLFQPAPQRIGADVRIAGRLVLRESTCRVMSAS